MFQMQKYDLVWTYTPGKYMFTVDALSNAIHPAIETGKTYEIEVEAYVDLFIISFNIADRKLLQIIILKT